MQAASFFQRVTQIVRPFPLLSLAGLALALFAQSLLEPPLHFAAAVVFYVAALGFVIWAVLRGEWKLSTLTEGSSQTNSRRLRVLPLLASVCLLGMAFVLFGDNRFTILNLTLWLLDLIFFVAAVRIPTQHKVKAQVDWEWLALLATVMLLAAFFRFYRLAEVPAEPFSDHAEKILDVFDISQGKTSIFFERNTGREAIQMYWTLLVAKIFGTGFSFLTLKIGTALLGFFALPFVYLLGKEYGNPLVGFFALFLFGIAYWPNVISRIGLRFPLYPLFAAATLLYLTRGLRTRSQNDFLLCGLFLGLGLHGYSPFRIMPFVVLTGFIIFILHNRSKQDLMDVLRWLTIVAATSLAVFLPLLRYWLAHPDIFGFRALSRLGTVGTEITSPLWIVFLKNLVNGLLMFNVDDGNILVNSIPHRPALDVVTGALFVIGVVLLITRYLRGRDWRDLFLLFLIPLLAMPSILSLAFPEENPALNRAGAAAVAVVLVSGRALEGLLAGFGADAKRISIAYILTAVILSASAWQNYELVFRKFDANYRMAVWNSSEMGAVIQEHGNLETAWIVPYWQWVDTRLPAIWMGEVGRDFALWPNELFSSTRVAGPKLFIFKPEDLETEISLKQLYPNGTLSRYTSASAGKDFMIFIVER